MTTQSKVVWRSSASASAAVAAGAISITGQVDPDALNLYVGSEKEAVHQTVPVYIPLLLPLLR